ncbi:shikimate dehydrogenase [Paenibacillus sp. Marseille-Q4541]|uniref:shikimate dehydrogenase n=1 Tax=Paenibacillus sp. Marseille-Q4541 TaxID=2831522 RepID=UPI001BACF959|nr:shikimate dehydrogenase [Paenibacillus sp. Marseille-Q4541]
MPNKVQERKPSGYTLLGVMGDPIAHSKSPAMHQIALQETGLQGSYVPLHVSPEGLDAAVRGIKAMGFRGVNVTIPHKVEIMAFMDELDDSAKLIGAVNTVVHEEDGRLIGYNTDGIGYVRSLKEEAVSSIEGKHIVVIGAGGAARGIVYALLLESPASVTILNRTVERAEMIASDFKSMGQVQGLATGDSQQVLLRSDIVINTTSVGMHPNLHETPIDPADLPEGIVVSDLIYNPLETKLLSIAKEKNCVIHGGLGMFVYQGAIAFEHWFGIPAPVNAMRRAVLQSF